MGTFKWRLPRRTGGTHTFRERSVLSCLQLLAIDRCTIPAGEIHNKCFPREGMDDHRVLTRDGVMVQTACSTRWSMFHLPAKDQGSIGEQERINLFLTLPNTQPVPPHWSDSPARASERPCRCRCRHEFRQSGKLWRTSSRITGVRRIT